MAETTPFPPDSEIGRSVSIEEATPAHAATLVEINRISWLDTYPSKEFGISREDIEARYANRGERVAAMEKTLREEQNERKHTWIAKDAHGVLGYCIAERLPDPNTPNEFRAINVLPESKGKGTGRKLMEASFAWLGGDKDIRLEVTSYNKDAIAFYEKLGFKDTGERSEYEVNAKKVPVSYMLKKAAK